MRWRRRARPPRWRLSRQPSSQRTEPLLPPTPPSRVMQSWNTSRRKVRDAHRERAVEARAVVDRIFHDLQLDVVDIETTEEYLPPLIGFFRARARALR